MSPGSVPVYDLYMGEGPIDIFQMNAHQMNAHKVIEVEHYSGDDSPRIMVPLLEFTSEEDLTREIYRLYDAMREKCPGIEHSLWPLPDIITVPVYDVGSNITPIVAGIYGYVSAKYALQPPKKPLPRPVEESGTQLKLFTRTTP